MGADSSAENTPNAPKFNMYAQVKQIGISMKKKASLGVRSPWV